MIDINELRRLAQDQEWIGRWYDAGCETLMAERDGEHEEVAHPMPIGLVPYLVAVQPAAITELLDRLEAAEKERDALHADLEKERKEHSYTLHAAEAEAKQVDRLRAKIEEMEQQEPVVYQHKVPCVNLQGELLGYTDWEDGKGLDDWPHRTLYALPGAQPAPGAPWVSLAERMPNPDKHDRVLIYTEGYDFGGEQVFDVKAEALNECRYIDPDEQPETCKAASHWMPHPRNAMFDYAAHCAQPAPSVPDAIDPITRKRGATIYAPNFISGWNACREEMLASTQKPEDE